MLKQILQIRHLFFKLCNDIIEISDVLDDFWG